MTSYTKYTGYNPGTVNIVTSFAPPLKYKGHIINCVSCIIIKLIHNVRAHVHVHTQVLHIATFELHTI